MTVIVDIEDSQLAGDVTQSTTNLFLDVRDVLRADIEFMRGHVRSHSSFAEHLENGHGDLPVLHVEGAVLIDVHNFVHFLGLLNFVG